MNSELAIYVGKFIRKEIRMLSPTVLQQMNAFGRVNRQVSCGNHPVPFIVNLAIACSTFYRHEYCLKLLHLTVKDFNIWHFCSFGQNIAYSGRCH